MTGTAERKTCQCGLAMLTTQGGARYCENCDGIQPQQRIGQARRKTQRDIRYNMYWLKVINEEYKDNRPLGIRETEIVEEETPLPGTEGEPNDE